MANARSIKSRIKSAKNIAQITKAMEMVSASKMRRAQERVSASAPYAQKIEEILHTLAGLTKHARHPLLHRTHHQKHALVVVISPDKGLAGALNANLFREITHVERDLKSRGSEASYLSVGKKGAHFLRYTRRTIYAAFDTFGDKPQYSVIQPIVQLIIDGFIEGKFDSVYVVYSKFISTLVQKSLTLHLLPLSLEHLPDAHKTHAHASAVPIFEPSSEEILDWLLPYYIEQVVFQCLLQSIASEHSARMIAMKNATDNARDIGKTLQLQYNSARQAAITQQIAEISSATMI